MDGLVNWLQCYVGRLAGGSVRWVGGLCAVLGGWAGGLGALLGGR